VLDLVLLTALPHVLEGLGARKLVGLELEVLLADLLHLGLDRGEVILADLYAFGQVDVIVEAIFSGGPKGEVRLGVQTFDGLGHDMRGRVTNDVQFLVGGALAHMAVVVENLHLSPSLRVVTPHKCTRTRKKPPRHQKVSLGDMRRLSGGPLGPRKDRRLDSLVSHWYVARHVMGTFRLHIGTGCTTTRGHDGP